MTNSQTLSSLILVIVFIFSGNVASAVTPEEFAKAAGEKVGEASKTGIDGAAEGWKFLLPELKHIAKGDFSATPAESGVEPAEVITEYDKQLKELGVRLILVPVPPKASVYPEKLFEGADEKSVNPAGPFLKKLQDAGVEVIDLEPEFAKLKEGDPDRLLYCAQDSHWSPYACEVVADLIAAKVKDAEWLVRDDAIEVGEPGTVKFHGDLLSEEEKASWTMEELPIRKVSKGGKQVELNADSPVLVVGDSHTLVFNDGRDMHSIGGGVVDHLAARLGTALDRVAQRASGAHGPRIDLARRSVQDPEMWGKKKLMIWCFSAREFTQGTWAKGIPAQVK